MRRFIWLGLVAVVLASVAIAVRVAYVHYQIQPLPSREEIAEAEEVALRHLRAEQSRDLPSLKDLPPIKPMKIEEALIIDHVGNLAPGRPDVSKPWHPAGEESKFAPEIDFRVGYSNEDDTDPPTVVVEVQQYPNEAWPLYYSKWSPMPRLLPSTSDHVLKRVSKFNNQVVVDRQFRFADESGKLWFFWPSGNNVVSITYSSKVIEEELLHRYLEKYPSSLN